MRRKLPARATGTGTARRAWLLPGSRRVTADGRQAPRQALVGPSRLAEQQVECRLCGEGCGPGAIGFPPRLGAVCAPVIDPTRCTGCGDCLALCPAGALRLV